MIAVILEFLILLCVKDVELYGGEDTNEQTAVEMQPMTRPTNGTDGKIHWKHSRFSLIIEE